MSSELNSKISVWIMLGLLVRLRFVVLGVGLWNDLGFEEDLGKRTWLREQKYFRVDGTSNFKYILICNFWGWESKLSANIKLIESLIRLELIAVHNLGGFEFVWQHELSDLRFWGSWGAVRWREASHVRIRACIRFCSVFKDTYQI